MGSKITKYLVLTVVLLELSHLTLLVSRVHVYNKKGEYHTYHTYSTTLRKVLELRRWWKVRARPQGGAQSPSMFNNHVNSDTLTYWSSRKIFYTKTVILRSTVTMKLTWCSPSYLTLQSEIQLFLDRQIPSELSGEMMQILKFLRTFDSGISPSLIVEPATRLD